MKEFRILAVSDTHGRREKLQRAIDQNRQINMIIHCGDGAKDITDVIIPDKTTVSRVMGNTDIYSVYGVEEENLESCNGMVLFITHGHKYNVKNGLHTLSAEGKRRDADIVIFGHTHIPFLKEGHPTLFNPGSLSEDSYGIITVTGENKCKFTHCRLGSEPCR